MYACNYFEQRQITYMLHLNNLVTDVRSFYGLTKPCPKHFFVTRGVHLTLNTNKAVNLEYQNLEYTSSWTRGAVDSRTLEPARQRQ